MTLLIWGESRWTPVVPKLRKMQFSFSLMLYPFSQIKKFVTKSSFLVKIASCNPPVSPVLSGMCQTRCETWRSEEKFYVHQMCSPVFIVPWDLRSVEEQEEGEDETCRLHRLDVIEGSGRRRTVTPVHCGKLGGSCSLPTDCIQHYLLSEYSPRLGLF